MSHVLLLIVGLVILTVGAEMLVRGASGIAARLGISPLIIGLTVVAFGTSAPELAVSVSSALSGQADIALGNVLGSNIFNVLFILGLSALIIPLTVARQLVRVDVPIMVGVSVLVLILGLDGSIGRWNGAFLFAGLLAYIGLQVILARREKQALALEEIPGAGVPGRVLFNVGLVVVGLIALVLGSKLLVSAAVAIAQGFGISELVVGLTIVAAGTSLPEVATSVVAALKGERDIAVGNVVGSNVFNLLGVLGLASALSPDGIKVAGQALQFDLPVMVAVAVACLPIFATGREIARWEGGLFLAYYIAYTTWLVMTATGNGALAAYEAAMLWFVLPLTAITLGIIWVRQIRQGGPGAGSVG
jgi:cation:H+ antiporter